MAAQGHIEVADAEAGISWWNALTEADRRFWLAAAVSAVPADAWSYYKLSTR
jgi:hypothetical protein